MFERIDYPSESPIFNRAPRISIDHTVDVLVEKLNEVMDYLNGSLSRQPTGNLPPMNFTQSNEDYEKLKKTAKGYGIHSHEKSEVYNKYELNEIVKQLREHYLKVGEAEIINHFAKFNASLLIKLRDNINDALKVVEEKEAKNSSKGD